MTNSSSENVELKFEMQLLWAEKLLTRSHYSFVRPLHIGAGPFSVGTLFSCTVVFHRIFYAPQESTRGYQSTTQARQTKSVCLLPEEICSVQRRTRTSSRRGCRVQVSGKVQQRQLFRFYNDDVTSKSKMEISSVSILVVPRIPFYMCRSRQLCK